MSDFDISKIKVQFKNTELLFSRACNEILIMMEEVNKLKVEVKKEREELASLLSWKGQGTTIDNTLDGLKQQITSLEKFTLKLKKKYDGIYWEKSKD